MAVFISNANFTALFTNTMDYIIQGLYDHGDTLICLLLGFSFLFHILSLRKNMALLRTIESLRTNNEQLTDRIKIIENQRLSEQVDTMIDKIDSISKGTRKLPERVRVTVEFDVQTLSQSFDKVTDRTYLQDGNRHDIQEKFKEYMLSLKEKIKTLESQVQNGDQKIDTSVKSLETYSLLPPTFSLSYLPVAVKRYHDEGNWRLHTEKAAFPSSSFRLSHSSPADAELVIRMEVQTGQTLLPWPSLPGNVSQASRHISSYL